MIGPIKATVLWTLAAGIEVPEDAAVRYFELMMLRRLIRELRINCVFDVGANRGQFATELRRIGYKGLIVSFEPQAEEFEALRRKFEKDRMWRGQQIALGARDGEAELHVFEGMTVLSSLLLPRQPQRNMRIERVRVRTLDSAFAEAVAGLDEPRIFLKMDTQGYDLEVFRGAVACREWLLGLQSELAIRPFYREMPHYVEALAAYEAAGFELFNLTTVARGPDRALQEVNCFMRRRSTGGAATRGD